MHDHPSQYNMGQQRISIVPACTKSIPHTSLLDDHSKCITREYGEQWKLITKQMIRTHQLLSSLRWKPAAPTQLLSGLDEEFSNLNSIYTSYQPLIQAATQLLQREPSFDGISVSSKYMKRSLLPFLGDALSWLTGTATTKDVNAIKSRVNQLISMQQQPARDPGSCHIDTQCHQICHPSKLTTYQHFSGCNGETHQEITTLYNIMHSLYSSISYHQIVLHIRSNLANLWDSLHYM